mmetsp:Transcript_73938/g.128245  ORF Transcript_73938/g.128245 Transcript_73938/m.128245 type:complete len:201 (+) Transcript_73938:691-1293(+)
MLVASRALRGVHHDNLRPLRGLAILARLPDGQLHAGLVDPLLSVIAKELFKLFLMSSLNPKSYRVPAVVRYLNVFPLRICQLPLPVPVDFVEVVTARSATWNAEQHAAKLFTGTIICGCHPNSSLDVKLAHSSLVTDLGFSHLEHRLDYAILSRCAAVLNCACWPFRGRCKTSLQRWLGTSRFHNGLHQSHGNFVLGVNR